MIVRIPAVRKKALILVAIGLGVVAAGGLTYYQLLKAGFVHYGK